MSVEVKKLNPGSILSESTYYIVKEVKGNDVICDINGQEVTLSKEYTEALLHSADQYSSEEQKTKTELAEIAIKSSRIAMTIAFYKQDKDKTKKAFMAEKAAKIAEIQNARVSEVESLLSNLIDNPILSYIPGELRIMKGVHYGDIDDLGRIQFSDMEIAQGHNMRQVDPRTIEYIIVNNIKYTLKK